MSRGKDATYSTFACAEKLFTSSNWVYPHPNKSTQYTSTPSFANCGPNRRYSSALESNPCTNNKGNILLAFFFCCFSPSH